jgi:hypothetical protein
MSYDSVVKFYDVQNKVFKIVADQGANIKKGFRDERECDQDDEIMKLTNEMLVEQKKRDFIKKQELLREQLEEEIQNANHINTNEEEKNEKKKSRDEVLEQLCDSEDDYENTDSKSDEGDSLLDCDQLDEIFEDFKQNEISEFLLNLECE